MTADDRNPTTGVSIALLVVGTVMTPWALWLSMWGGYADSTGLVITQWVVIILLCAASGGLSLARAKPTRSAFGPSEPVSVYTPRRSVLRIVVGAVFLGIAVLEGLVLIVNLPGGQLREALAVILVVLLGFGGLFLSLGIRRR